jgi:hypothetical protein
MDQIGLWSEGSRLHALLAGYLQTVMQARRLVGDGDVGAEAPRKRAENTRAETAAGAVGGWRTDGRTSGFRPVEQHAGRNFLQLDLNGAVGSRQCAVLQRIGDQLVQDQGEVLCQLRVERTCGRPCTV